jgi:serine/threonine-protein kinase HipA
MSNVSVLNVLLYNEPIGTLTLLNGDRSIFAFNENYLNNPQRPTLSLSFIDEFGGLIDRLSPVQTKVEPFFSNLLPEGHLRHYLAERANVKEAREFFLLWVLGRDLPGAVTLIPADVYYPLVTDTALPTPQTINNTMALKFSLAGVQLKFSALKNEGNHGCLTIPLHGSGGSWIVKLPSLKNDAVPENEFSMMTLAKKLGMDVPEIMLVDVKDIAGLPNDLGTIQGKAFAIRRFDRTENGPVHIEDFAQVFNVYPEVKYEKATYRRIAKVLSITSSESSVTEFIRRMIFNTLIGNGDMHLKNWSLIYKDRYRPELSPVYDFVSTIPYIPNDKAALKYSRTNIMQDLDYNELSYFAAKALIPETLVLNTTRQTVAQFLELWYTEKTHLELSAAVITAIDKHLAGLKIVQES